MKKVMSSAPKIPSGPDRMFSLKNEHSRKRASRKKEFFEESQKSYFYTADGATSLVKEPGSLNYSEVEPMLDFLEHNRSALGYGLGGGLWNYTGTSIIYAARSVAPQ